MPGERSRNSGDRSSRGEASSYRADTTGDDNLQRELYSEGRRSESSGIVRERPFDPSTVTQSYDYGTGDGYGTGGINEQHWERQDQQAGGYDYYASQRGEPAGGYEAERPPEYNRYPDPRVQARGYSEYAQGTEATERYGGYYEPGREQRHDTGEAQDSQSWPPQSRRQRARDMARAAYYRARNRVPEPRMREDAWEGESTQPSQYEGQETGQVSPGGTTYPPERYQTDHRYDDNLYDE